MIRILPEAASPLAGNVADAAGDRNSPYCQITLLDLSIWTIALSNWQGRQFMDDIDARLIQLLRHDGRRSVSDLSAEMGLSRATVRARMEKLERSGEIVGYTVILRSETVDMPVRGLMLIEIEGRAADRVVDSLGNIPEVTAVHTTNGKWDLIAEIATFDLSALDAALRRIRLIPGITGSETSLLLATPRSTRARLA
jgi:DNA-binding Lrp family transcriptional regulator